MPWVLAASAAAPLRRAGAGVAPLALACGLQGLCGEPVTWVATGVLAAASAPVASAFRRTLSTLVGLALGGLLAAAQLVPTMAASLRAHRGMLATPDFW